jgi:hypothetical protein
VAKFLIEKSPSTIYFRVKTIEEKEVMKKKPLNSGSLSLDCFGETEDSNLFYFVSVDEFSKAVQVIG